MPTPPQHVEERLCEGTVPRWLFLFCPTWGAVNRDDMLQKCYNEYMCVYIYNVKKNIYIYIYV